MTGSTRKRHETCNHCGKSTVKRGYPRSMYFCNIQCKSDWQRTQKPVDKEWLYQKYVIEGLSANQIAVIVKRNSKRVWEWIKDYGIETKSRGMHRSSSSTQFPKGHKLGVGRVCSTETRAKISAIAKAQGRVPFDPKVGPPFKGKRGPEIPSWRGGVTPERQAFYSTPEWKAIIPQVYKRDDARCQKCGTRNNKTERFKFDIHHIVPFECRHLRSSLDNLVLLCEKCHYWVHSNGNTNRDFIMEVPQ